MSVPAVAQLVLATAFFIAAATVAKAWAVAPSVPLLALTLGCYTAGNLIMLRLIRLIGMATAFSLSAIFQLVAVSLVAVLVYGERVTPMQGMGLALAVVATALITLGPSLP